MTGIVMRVHRVRSEVIVAACDEELLGRDLAVGSSGRKMTISSHFYGERAVSDEELAWAFKRATIVNLLGERVLSLARRLGLVDENGTGTLGGVPHAEVFTMSD